MQSGFTDWPEPIRRFALQMRATKEIPLGEVVRKICDVAESVLGFPIGWMTTGDEKQKVIQVLKGMK